MLGVPPMRPIGLHERGHLQSLGNGLGWHLTALNYSLLDFPAQWSKLTSFISPTPTKRSVTFLNDLGVDHPAVLYSISVLAHSEVQNISVLQNSASWLVQGLYPSLLQRELSFWIPNIKGTD